MIKIDNVNVYDLERSIVASGYPMNVDLSNAEYEIENLEYYLGIDICNIIDTIQGKLNDVKLFDYYFSFLFKGEEIMFNYEDYTCALEVTSLSQGYAKTPKGFAHNLILSCEGKYTDHINRNKLDNRRQNLRICTAQENSFNKGVGKNNKSGFAGVCYKQDKHKWKAFISPSGKQIHLGYFDDIRDAIKARLQAEIEYFGEYAPQLYLCEEYGIEKPFCTSKSKLNALNAYKHLKRIKSLALTPQGSGHNQALTGIRVAFDLTCSNKMWVEAERYRFLEFVSSQSTMHRICKFDIKSQCNNYVDDRIIDIIRQKVARYNRWNGYKPTKEWFRNNKWDIKTQEQYADYVKDLYLEVLYNIPSGFELTARLTTNYRCLKTIYSQRKNHRLPEWREFCKWIKTLPYAELITGEEK